MASCRLFASLLLTLTTASPAGVAGDEGRSKVYSLQRGVWTRPSTRVYISHDIQTGLPPSTHLSVCYRIRVEKFVDHTVHLSYATSDKNPNALLFYNVATEMVAFVNNVRRNLTIQTPLDILPETWNHFCHVITPQQYTIYWQGKNIGGGAGVSLDFPINGTLILGQEQDTLAGEFARSQVLHGDITQVNFWARELSAGEVEELAGCQSVMQGDVFSLDAADVTRVGRVPVADVAHQNLCRSAPHYLVLPERRSVVAALAQCRLLDAQMAVPASDADNRQLQRAIQPYLASCSGTPWKLWLGVSDTRQEGVWTSFATGTETPYSNFVPPFPYGGSLDNCAALFSDGTWGDAKCSLKKCSACEINPENFLRLRGLCFEDEHHSRFRASGHVDGRPLFRGFYDLLIAWNKTQSRWLLKNIHNTTLATMAPSSLEEYPLGMRTWSVESLLCGAHPGEKLELSLSPCSTDRHFMCHSGQCIVHRHRCNMKYECEDGSDEDDCNMVNVQRGYRSHLTPPGRGGFNRAGVIAGGGIDDILGPVGDKLDPASDEGEVQTRDTADNSPLILTPAMTVTQITTVDDTDMAVTVELRITLTWTDDRLAFSHLAGVGRGAVLSQEDVSKIWVPQYGLQQLKGGRGEVMQQSVKVDTANNPTPPNFNTIKMDLVYPGKHNALSLTMEHLATFTCPQRHYTHPFTLHRCPFTIVLPHTYKNLVRFDPLKEVVFSGPREVGHFSVIQVSPGQASEDQFSVQVELQHHGISLFLSLFVPTLLLLGISWASFFVVWEAMLVRVVLSLGTLLLLYTLRLLPIALSMPPTPSITLIDVWNFFAVVVLSVNTVVHILIPQPPSYDPNLKRKPLLVAPAGNSGVVIRRESEDVQPCSPRAVLAYRTLILPSALIVFNITFWLLILTRQPW